MNSRERVLIALNGEEPDRVPCALAFYALDIQALFPHGVHREDMVDIEFVAFPLSPEERELERRAKPYAGDTRLGSQSQAANYARWGYHPERPGRENPLQKAVSLADLENFPFPMLSQPYQVPGLELRVAEIHARGLAVGGNLPHLGGELFEAAWRLRGLENFMLDMIERPEWVHFLLDRLTELSIRNAEALARSGIDVLALDDDIGMPGTLMISPQHWRLFFKPRLSKIIQAARRIHVGLPVVYHSDGTFNAILDDLIEIGVNAINPLQPEHMPALTIRRRFGSRLVLWGTVGRQTTFSFGTQQEIRDEVKERIETLGRSGLVLCPAYDVDEPDVPWQNVFAFLQAVREYG
jgi:uroporphyrinogen decarboxylase